MNLSWEVLFGAGALVIALAIAWGMMRNRTRNRANDPLTEAATREQYDHPKSYAAEQDAYREEVRPPR